MRLLINNIKELVGIDPDNRPCLRGAEMMQLNTLSNAWLYIKDEIIAGYGSMNQPETQIPDGGDLQKIDATGKMVFPSFCDSHTHLVYAGSRELEYVDTVSYTHLTLQKKR